MILSQNAFDEGRAEGFAAGFFEAEGQFPELAVVFAGEVEVRGLARVHVVPDAVKASVDEQSVRDVRVRARVRRTQFQVPSVLGAFRDHDELGYV